jgi:hypothetical protein
MVSLYIFGQFIIKCDIMGNTRNVGGRSGIRASIRELRFKITGELKELERVMETAQHQLTMKAVKQSLPYTLKSVKSVAGILRPVEEQIKTLKFSCATLEKYLRR